MSKDQHEITGKTVYVLGAGASCHTGAPLLSNFLVQAQTLMESEQDLIYQEHFKTAFDWIMTLRSQAHYLNLDLDNLEHVFSVAEMKKQVGDKDGDEVFSALRYLILETLDRRCTLDCIGGRLLPDNVYSSFVRILKELNEKRQSLTRQGHGVFENDSIITFNYDVMLDHAFGGWEPDYCLSAPQVAGPRIKLLKLHGSTNWGQCKECGDDPRVMRANPVAPGYQIPYELEDGARFPFRMCTHVLKETECDQCKQKDVLEPFVIAPTWSKIIRNEWLATVWSTAIREISNCFQIVVIGYSLPVTDTFFQYLLALGLAGDSKLHRVVIVNNDQLGQLHDRYQAVFQGLHGRSQLHFCPMTFEDFVRTEKMTYIGSSLTLP